jgi:hypothetical protein
LILLGHVTGVNAWEILWYADTPQIPPLSIAVLRATATKLLIILARSAAEHLFLLRSHVLAFFTLEPRHGGSLKAWWRRKSHNRTER